jgi:hypothetical protein
LDFEGGAALEPSAEEIDAAWITAPADTQPAAAAEEQASDEA